MKRWLRSSVLVALLGAVLGAAPGASASNGPVLSLAQRDLLDPVPAGSQMVSVIEIGNVGQAPATEVTVTLEILEDQSCNDGACPPIASYRSGCDQVQGRFMTCVFPEIAAGVMIPMAAVLGTTELGVVRLAAVATAPGAETVSSVETTDVVTVTPDGTPPTSVASGIPEDWVNRDVDVTITATDDTDPAPSILVTLLRRAGGCGPLYWGYTCDAWWVFDKYDSGVGPTLPLRFSTPGQYQILYHAHDRDLNIELPVHEAFVRIDKARPTGDLTKPANLGSGGPLPVYGSLATFEASARDDDGSGRYEDDFGRGYYKLDMSVSRIPSRPEDMPGHGVVCFDVRDPLGEQIGCFPATASEVPDEKYYGIKHVVYQASRTLRPGLFRVALRIVDRAGNAFTTPYREFAVLA